MASPQLENGYTKIANEILEALIRYRIPGEQMQCLLHVFRMTYGWDKKEANISYNDFVKATGIKRPNVIRAVKGLIEKNIISGIKSDTSKVSSYGFNKKYKTWRVVSKVIPGIKSDTKGGIKSDTKVVSKQIPLKPVSFSRNKYKENIKKHPPKKTVLKNYLKSKITDDLKPHQNKIIEFFNYRQSLPKKNNYKTEKGIDGLFRDIATCIDQGFCLEECLDVTMEREWLTPNPVYFEKIKLKSSKEESWL